MPNIKQPDLTILNGQTKSNEVLHPRLRFVAGLTFFSPATLPETVTIEVSDKKTPGASDWRTLQSGGSDVVLGAGKAAVVVESPFASLRLSASGAVAADRVFGLVYAEESLR